MWGYTVHAPVSASCPSRKRWRPWGPRSAPQGLEPTARHALLPQRAWKTKGLNRPVTARELAGPPGTQLHRPPPFHEPTVWSSAFTRLGPPEGGTPSPTTPPSSSWFVSRSERKGKLPRTPARLPGSSLTSRLTTALALRQALTSSTSRRVPTLNRRRSRR
jgi:hypothetical protein